MSIFSDKKTSRIAIASLICFGIGVLSILLFALTVFLPMEDVGHFVLSAMISFPLAFVLGVLSLIVITIRRKVLKGYILAILVIVLSTPTLFVINGFRLGANVRKEREKTYTCKYNLRLLGKELIKYAEDNGGHLPTAGNWCDVLIEYNHTLTKDVFKHPLHPSFNPPTYPPYHPDFEASVQKVDPSFKVKPMRKLHLDGECNIAFNRNLSGLDIKDIAPDTVLIWEANGERNLSGGSELLETRRKDQVIKVVLFDQSMVSYHYDHNAYRTYDSGTMQYESLSW